MTESIDITVFTPQVQECYALGKHNLIANDFDAIESWEPDCHRCSIQQFGYSFDCQMATVLPFLLGSYGLKKDIPATQRINAGSQDSNRKTFWFNRIKAMLRKGPMPIAKISQRFACGTETIRKWMVQMEQAGIVVSIQGINHGTESPGKPYRAKLYCLPEKESSVS